MDNNTPYTAKDFHELTKEYGILMSRKEVQKNFKISNSKWDALVNMGVIKALDIGLKSKYYGLLNILSIEKELRKNQNFLSNQL